MSSLVHTTTKLTTGVAAPSVTPLPTAIGALPRSHSALPPLAQAVRGILKDEFSDTVMGHLSSEAELQRAEDCQQTLQDYTVIQNQVLNRIGVPQTAAGARC